VRSSPVAAAQSLYGNGSPFVSAQIDQWLDFSQKTLLQPSVMADFRQAQLHWNTLNHHLKFRSFLAGYQLSIADLCVFGALKSMSFYRTKIS
jgi:glutathione S-transferase